MTGSARGRTLSSIGMQMRSSQSCESHLVLLSQKDIKRKPLENQIKVEIRAAARRRLG